MSNSSRAPARSAPASSRTPGGVAAVAVLAIASASLAHSAPESTPASAPLTRYLDPTGVLGVYDDAGPIDTANPFFRALGTNGRSCATCHQPSMALSFTPAYARAVYVRTRGRDPLFAAVDGANCPDGTGNDPGAHSLLLRYGLIRIGLKVPANAEFSISAVHDPYGCALRIDPATGALTASVYRRPLPSANLRFLSAVMFDGRQTGAPLSSPTTFAANLRADLISQALDATMGHAQASAAPSAADLAAIVDFESSLYAAQASDRTAGPLAAGSAFGGPLWLAGQTYHPGINDSLGGDPNGGTFSAAAMQLFENWASAAGSGDLPRFVAARSDIAAGERIFDSAPLKITQVRGLNDNPALGAPAVIDGTCTTCHDSPNVGDHSMPLPLDIGTSHASLPGMESDPNVAAALAQLDAPDLPVFLISGCPNPFGSGEPVSFYTTDPARALITGKCSDFNRGKGPVLRGLAARAPYFHNGAAATLGELVNFYDRRFEMGLSEQQKAQLVAFLNSL